MKKMTDMANHQKKLHQVVVFANNLALFYSKNRKKKKRWRDTDHRFFAQGMCI